MLRTRAAIFLASIFLVSFFLAAIATLVEARADDPTARPRPTTCEDTPFSHPGSQGYGSSRRDRIIRGEGSTGPTFPSACSSELTDEAVHASAGAQQRAPESGTDSIAVVTEAVSEPRRVDPSLLATITDWLVDSFALPAAAHPRIAFVPPTRIAAFRYRGFTPIASDDRAMLDTGRETMAVYDDATRTIYLPERWSGANPVELSVLVHELVHHLQNVAQLTHECPQEREKLAYVAQDRWLGLFNLTLADEFEIDPFTLLVRTKCMG
jgi:hypothetical protein